MEIRLEAVKHDLPVAFVRRFMDLYALAGKFKAANASKIQAVGNGTLISACSKINEEKARQMAPNVVH